MFVAAAVVTAAPPQPPAGKCQELEAEKFAGFWAQPCSCFAAMPPRQSAQLPDVPENCVRPGWQLASRSPAARRAEKLGKCLVAAGLSAAGEAYRRGGAADRWTGLANPLKVPFLTRPH